MNDNSLEKLYDLIYKMRHKQYDQLPPEIQEKFRPFMLPLIIENPQQVQIVQQTPQQQTQQQTSVIGVIAGYPLEISVRVNGMEKKFIRTDKIIFKDGDKEILLSNRAFSVVGYNVVNAPIGSPNFAIYDGNQLVCTIALTYPVILDFTKQIKVKSSENLITWK